MNQDNLNQENKDLAEVMRHALENSWGTSIPIPKIKKKIF
jgi:hypothetical protein